MTNINEKFRELTPEEYDEKAKMLHSFVDNNSTIDSVEISLIRLFDNFYKPGLDLETKLSQMGFNSLQIHSLIAQYNMSINNIELETVPVIEPAEYEGKDLPGIQWIVVGMLPEGVSLLAGPPKYFKSTLALQLAVAVCTGNSFFGFDVVHGDVIYFDLESNPHRPLNRLNTIFSTTNFEKLHIITAKSGIHRLDEGFEKEFEELLIKYRNTRLVVIDVLARIIPAKAKDNVYSSDYETINKLNAFATKYKIAILVVHHTRKMKDDSDPINNITGSTGLTGAVNSIIEIQKDKRTNNNATLLITGNDVETREIGMHTDLQRVMWVCDGDVSELAFKEFTNAPESQTITELMKNSCSWSGTSSQLSSFAMDMGYDITPEAFGRYFNTHISDLNTLGYIIKRTRNGSERTITICRKQSGTSVDDPSQPSYPSQLSQPSEVSQLEIKFDTNGDCL